MADRPGKISADKLSVLGNSLRLAIVSRLTLQPATAAEVAEELDQPAEKVRYHLRWLRNRDLVDVEEKVSRRGRLQNVYSADPRKHLIQRGELNGVAGRRFDLAQARLLRLMFREAIDAARAGIYDNRPEHTLLRVLLPLDEKGWEEATAIHDRVTEEVLAVREESQVRQEAGEEQAILTRVATLFFERRNQRQA
ncbi:MAG: helix-turn-helix domain-containing protein [Solirubrobacterales bacterium]